MPGGVIQLLKLGEEDKYLIGTPQITFFKTVFKRHSNFSMENINSPLLEDFYFYLAFCYM